MRAIRIAMLAAVVVFGATTAGDAGNMNSGWHFVFGQETEVWTWPNEDACMVTSQGSTVGILDGVHRCSEESCPNCAAVAHRSVSVD